MKNPWLRIPASDYEAHMALPEVAQAQALNKLMASALKEYTPGSLAVIGCSTGNGFEHIDTTHSRRVVGVDINPAYLAILNSRFAGKIPRLELIRADISDPVFQIDSVSMVFAGLVFEYVDVSVALGSIARCLDPGAILLAVLQLPSPKSVPVTATRYKSLELLAPIMNMVSPYNFSNMCCNVGLKQIKTDMIPLTRISHGQSTAVADRPKPTALRLKNDFDVLIVRLHPFFFPRLVSIELSTTSLRRPVRNAG